MTDGGQTWFVLDSMNLIILRDVYFLNDDTGFACGGLAVGYIYKTTDGGISWIQNSPDNPTYVSILSVRFPSYNKGYAVGTSNIGGPSPINMLKTIDDGDSWNLVYNSTTGNAVYATGSVFFIDSITGYAGKNSGILKTTDGGDNWYLYNYLYGIYDMGLPYSIYFPNKDTGYYVGLNNYFNPVIYKTIDAGNSWYKTYFNDTIFSNDTIQTMQELMIYSIFCIDGNNCFAVGDSGIILKTTNGGESTSVVDNVENTNEIVIYPNPGNDKLIINIESEKNTNISLTIFDLQGREIFTDKINKYSNQYQLNISKFNKGIYIIQIKIGKEIINKKIVIK